jgi:hypothetical protein
MVIGDWSKPLTDGTPAFSIHHSLLTIHALSMSDKGAK